MAVATLLFVGIPEPLFAKRAHELGYAVLSVPDVNAIGSVDAPYDLMLIHGNLIRDSIDSIIERLYFLNNNVPIAVCIDAHERLDAQLSHAFREGTLDVLYYNELPSDLIFARIDKLFVFGLLDKNLRSLQENIREKETLRRELSIRSQLVDQERELNAHIIDSITSGMVILDMSGAILRINEAARRLLNFALSEYTGITYRSIFSKEMVVLIDRLFRAMQSKDLGEIHKVRLNETYLQVSGFGMLDSQQTSRGMILFIQDITEQENTAVQLYRTEKLATVGTMLSGIAHELRNPLSIISARVQRALGRKEWDREWMSKTLDSVEKQTQRCSSIVNNLLDFTRHSATALGYHKIGEVLDETLTYVEYQNIFDTISIIKEYGEGLEVFGDRSRFVQIFLNIITNAADAMAGRGSLTLSTAPYGQQYVLAQITDTGPGIPPEIQNRIFDPFFTTKDPGKGTGLGLAIVHKIVQESGGEVWLKSKSGSTAFFIKLPSTRERKA